MQVNSLETSSLTLVIPVYGESPYLVQALDSTLPLLASNTRLLVIDDGMSVNALNFLQNWLDSTPSDLIMYVKNPSNLGLFKSLNTNLSLVETEWFCFLCSDDYFLSDAIHKIQKLSISSDVGVVLSRFQSVNSDSSNRYDDAQDLSKLISQYGYTLSPDHMLHSLLCFGSLNGNLSGMIISKNLWDYIGGFKEDWFHAADWDWLVNASNLCWTQINPQCLVAVRTHKNQLSTKNQQNGSPVLEAVTVIKQLRKQTHSQNQWLSLWWASCLMQHHLWNLLFANPTRRDYKKSKQLLLAIQTAAPLWAVFVAMIVSIPHRIYRKTLILLVSCFGE